MVRKRRKKSKNYFTQDTEDAIVLYNNTSDSEVRALQIENQKLKEILQIEDNSIPNTDFNKLSLSLNVNS